MLIDVHGHIGQVVPDRGEFIDAWNLIAKMDAWGIDVTCVLALSEFPEGGYLESSTEDVLAACSRIPDRLIPFCLIDPRRRDGRQADSRQLLEDYRSRGCKGVGEFLPKLPVDAPSCLELYRAAGELGMPVLFDMMACPQGYGLVDEPALPRLERTLRECPGTVFIGHGPTFWAEISCDVPAQSRSGYPKGPVGKGGAVPRLMRRYGNLRADLSAGSGYNALTRDPAFGAKFLEEFQDQLLFGTDSCRRSDLATGVPIVPFFRSVLRERKCSEVAWEKIAWRNAGRLLGIAET